MLVFIQFWRILKSNIILFDETLFDETKFIEIHKIVIFNGWAEKRGPWELFQIFPCGQ